MILILAQHFELNVNNVCEILDHYGAPWFRLNGEDMPGQTRLQVDCTQNPPNGLLVDQEGRSLSAQAVRSVWSRRHGEFQLDPSLTVGQRHFIQKECAHALLGFYSMLEHAAWMNDYFVELKAVNKPYQLAVAQTCGLAIPPSLVTQDPVRARQFYEEQDCAVLTKAVSQSGHVPGDDTRQGRLIYANKLNPDDHPSFDDVLGAPTLFQRYMEKEYELRVTVVGNAVFAAAIESQRSERSKVDWRRYDTRNTPYYPYRLPGEVEQALLTLMRRLGLEYGAADFIKTPDGQYVFLEVNPGGQWGWIEGMTGHPINEAIAKWLMSRGGCA